MAGGVAQGEGPEFKPQYHKKKKRKKERKFILWTNYLILTFSTLSLKIRKRGWVCSSAVEALGLIPSTDKKIRK
jgi:hypothetical protein